MIDASNRDHLLSLAVTDFNDVRDQGNNTPLHKACERNSTLTVVKLLLERGASLTATNNDGETALDVAIKNDKKSIVAYLTRLGAKSAVVASTDLR